MDKQELYIIAKVTCKALAIFIALAIAVVLFSAYFTAPVTEINTGHPYVDLMVRFIMVLCVIAFALGYIKACFTLISKM